MMEGTGANMDSILDLDYGITGYGISSSETKLDSLLLRKNMIHREIFNLFHFLKWNYAQAFCPSSYSSQTYALSFYRSQNVLCRSKFFEPVLKFDCI